jgi:hypothetical protein
MSVVEEVARRGRCKSKRKAHSREGANGTQACEAGGGRRRPGKGSRPTQRPGPAGPKSKEDL